ncbi:MAG: hypothetical protein R3F44_08665 [Candidatus Competibacteraceae bacterium]
MSAVMEKATRSMIYMPNWKALPANLTGEIINGRLWRNHAPPIHMH